MVNVLEATSRAVVEICGAGDRGQLCSALGNATRALGFDSFNLGCNKGAKSEFMTDPTITSWTYDTLVAYERDRWAETDPLLDYAASGKPSLLWTTSYWDRSDCKGYFEYIKYSGIHAGVTAPLSRNDGTVSAITLLSASPRELDASMAHAVSIIGSVAMLRAETIGILPGQDTENRIRIKSLTGLQLEILSWVAKGKTNLEIAIILGRSNRAINYHMIEILKKMDVVSRSHAAAIYSSI